MSACVDKLLGDENRAFKATSWLIDGEEDQTSQ